MNNEIYKYVKAYPVNSFAVTKSSEEILNRVIAEYTLASAATYAFCAAYNLIKPALDSLDERYKINTLLTYKDKNLLLNIVNMKYSAEELEEISYSFEKCEVYLWVLGLLSIPNSKKKCSIKQINTVILGANSYSDLLNKVNMKSAEELEEFSSLLNSYYIESKTYDVNDEIVHFNERIVKEQQDAIDFITSNEEIDNNLRIECNKDDLNFSFIIRDNLKFDKVSEKSDEIIALKSEDGLTKIIIQDLDKCEKQEYEEKCNKYIELFKENGFNIVNEIKLNSENLDNDIKQVVINKGELILNSYFMLISNHLVRLDSLADKSIDHENYNENINSKNTNIDLDIIFSIKMI